MQLLMFELNTQTFTAVVGFGHLTRQNWTHWLLNIGEWFTWAWYVTDSQWSCYCVQPLLLKTSSFVKTCAPDISDVCVKIIMYDVCDTSSE